MLISVLRITGTRNPNFLRRWAFLQNIARRFTRSEEDSEKVTVRSEISTWWVVLAVTFGILYDEKILWIVNPIMTPSKSHGRLHDVVIYCIKTIKPA